MTKTTQPIHAAPRASSGPARPVAPRAATSGPARPVAPRAAACPVAPRAASGPARPVAPRAIRAALAVCLAALLLAACNTGTSEPEPSLEPWAGTWNSLSVYLDKAPIKARIEAHATALRDETKRASLTAEAVRTFAQSLLHTPFASLTIQGNTIRFYPDPEAAGTPIAELSYAFRQEAEGLFCFEAEEAGSFARYLVLKKSMDDSRSFFAFAYAEDGFEAAFAQAARAPRFALNTGPSADTAASLLFAALAETPAFSNWGRSLVCLGDSLTAGRGATEQGRDDPSKAYPAVLQQKVKLPVVNRGVSAAFSNYGVATIKSLLAEENPRILIIELGANDFLLGGLIGGIPVSNTKENLRAIIDAADDGERALYLVKFYTEDVADSLQTAPGGSPPLTDNLREEYNAMFEELAKSPNVTLISDIWTDIWGNPDLMSDAHHPNAAGYASMASLYLKALRPYLQAHNLLLPENPPL
jgi:acyl-CoA thioesterase-1